MSRTKKTLVKVENNDKRFEEYEELLLERDRLIRDSSSYELAYTVEFGDMITANFELKVECIKKKKTISYCRRRMNRAIGIDTDSMQKEIDKEMTLYYSRLKEMAAENELAKRACKTSEYSRNKAKKIYRRLAKLIHPDINKMTSGNEQLSELWTRISRAYQNTNDEELENLEVLVKRAMDALGDGSFELKLDNIEDRIERLEAEINEIMTTEPYTYMELLLDDEKKKAHKDELLAEHDDYEQYLETLTKTLDEMLQEGGVKLVWKIN